MFRAWGTLHAFRWSPLYCPSAWASCQHMSCPVPQNIPSSLRSSEPACNAAMNSSSMVLCENSVCFFFMSTIPLHCPTSSRILILNSYPTCPRQSPRRFGFRSLWGPMVGLHCGRTTSAPSSTLDSRNLLDRFPFRRRQFLILPDCVAHCKTDIRGSVLCNP